VLGNPHPVLTPCPPDALIAAGPAWGAWLTETGDAVAIATLRANTYTGWPTGSDTFIARLEAQLGRRLSRQPAGRKKRPDGNR
jgi:hypothetical protein